MYIITALWIWSPHFLEKAPDHSATVLENLGNEQDSTTDYLQDLEPVSKLFPDKYLWFANDIGNHFLNVCSCVYDAANMPNTSHNCTLKATIRTASRHPILVGICCCQANGIEKC